MHTLAAYIEGIGLLGPGFSNWPDSRAVICGQQPCRPVKTVLPLPALLPAAERRRSGAMVRLTLATGLEAVTAAGLDAASLPTVFSASGSDGENCHAICEMLASDDRQISPTRFHNSVHNAASGYWSISTGATPTSSVLCAHDGSFSAGLLEALTQAVVDNTPVLLVAYDTHYPEPLNGKRPVPDTLGVALVLSPRPSERSLARITLSCADGLSDTAAAVMGEPALEFLRQTIPAARALPLLRLIASQQAATVALDYLDDLRLAVDIAPP